MAMMPRNYALIGITDEDIAKHVTANSAQVIRTSPVPPPSLTLDVDDTVPGLLETLDDYLKTKGYVRIP